MSGGTGRIPASTSPDRRRSRPRPRASLRILGTRAAEMLGAVLLRLPVHPRRALVEDLHAIAAHVALAGLRILRDHHRPGDVAPAVLRPALQDGKIKERKPLGADDLLAIAAANRLWEDRAKLGQFRQHLHFVEEPLRRLHIENVRNPAGDFVERIHFQREVHPALAAHEVRHRRNSRSFRTLEKKRRAAGFDGAVGDFRDFEDRVDFHRYAPQLAFFVQLS